MNVIQMNTTPRKPILRLVDFLLSHFFKFISVIIIGIALTQNVTTQDGDFSGLILVIGLLMWVNGIKDSMYFQKREGKDISDAEGILPLLLIIIIFISFFILYFR